MFMVAKLVYMGNIRRVSLFSMLIVAILILLPVNAVHGVGLIGKITVGNEPYGVAYDPSKGEVFVTNNFYNTVSVISDINNTVVANIPVGLSPEGLAYDYRKSEVFVANTANLDGINGNISVISDTNNTVIATVLLSGRTYPMGVAYDFNKGEIFVTDNNVGSVSVISDNTNSVIATINVGLSPEGVTYDSDKSEIFVANDNSSTVSVISDSNNTVIATIPVGHNPAWVAYDSGASEIFVTNGGDKTVSVISDNTDNVVATIPLGESPSGLTYDFGKDEIFVATYSGISVISDKTDNVIATLNGAKAPMGIAYDSGKGEIFVANSYVSFNYMLPPTISNTVLVISDSPNLAAPSIFSSSSVMDQGQAANLVSNVTTGASPYMYQWFSEAPGNLSYVLIDNATASSYEFATTRATATGNWSFILQVTDATGAVVNSTATHVTVNSSTPSPATTVGAFGARDLIAAVAVIIIVSVVAVTLLLRKKRT